MHTIEFIDTEGKRRFVKTDRLHSGMSENMVSFIAKDEYNKDKRGKNKIKGVKKVLKITEDKKGMC